MRKKSRSRSLKSKTGQDIKMKIVRRICSTKVEDKLLKSKVQDENQYKQKL